MIRRVELSKLAKKQLKKIPRHIIEKLAQWTEDVETRGLEEVRKVPGYHDEPLSGDRAGQRSIRLNLSYRAIYEILDDQQVKFVQIEEVTNHAY